MKRLLLALGVVVLAVGTLQSASAAPILYLLDDGTGETNLGTTTGDMIWLNQFDTTPAPGAFITEVQVAYGAVADGTAATVALWEDPNDDGDPSDAALLYTVGTTVANNGTDIFNSIGIPDVQVAGSFFVGLYCSHIAFSEYPARLDQTTSLGRSWAAIGADLTDLTNNALPVALMDGLGYPGNWMVRAVGTDIPEPATLSLLAAGLVGVALKRRRR